MSMNETIAISRYGLHEHLGVKYLHQHSGIGHNFLGLPRESPFELVYSSPRPPMCPHNFNVSVSHPDRVHWGKFCKYAQDPFFRAFIPVPRDMADPIPFLDDPDGKWASLAVLFSRLASPVAGLVINIEHHRPSRILAMLETTNVAPLVLCGIETRHQSMLEEIVSQASFLPRKLIVLGKPMVVVRYPMKRIHSMMDQVEPLSLIPLPLESLGSVALRRYARGEPFDELMEKKDDEYHVKRIR